VLTMGKTLGGVYLQQHAFASRKKKVELISVFKQLIKLAVSPEYTRDIYHRSSLVIVCYVPVVSKEKKQSKNVSCDCWINHLC